MPQTGTSARPQRRSCAAECTARLEFPSRLRELDLDLTRRQTWYHPTSLRFCLLSFRVMRLPALPSFSSPATMFNLQSPRL